MGPFTATVTKNTSTIDDDLSIYDDLYVNGDISFVNSEAHFFVAGYTSFNREVDISGRNVAFSLETLFNETETIDSSFQTIDSSFQTIDSSFQTIDSSFQTIESSFQTIDSSFQTIDSSFQTIDSSFQTIDSSFQTIDSSFQTIENIVKPIIESRVEFSTHAFTTQTSNIQDLSQNFYHEITPFNNIGAKILVDINVTLYCCYALEERITVELWRDTTKLTRDNNLGSINATGGLTIPYHLNYVDTTPANGINRYYLKYQLENNNSNQSMGLINISTQSFTGSSGIILREV